MTPEFRCRGSRHESAVAQLFSLGIMRISQTFRWWILFTFLLIIIVPVWILLGDFLGYDIMPAPDPAPPRYSSHLLGSCYYIILVALPLLVLFWVFWLGAILVSLIYLGLSKHIAKDNDA